MNRRFPMFLLILFLALITGCAEESNSGSIQTNDEERPEESVELEMSQQNIQLFFADGQALGLVETNKDIVYEDESDKFEKAFLALTETPDDAMVALWEEGAIERIQLSEGVLALEIKKEGIQQGSAAERLQILSLLKTMFQFSEVVEIQINGQDQNQYGGQLDISEPFTRDTVADL